MVLQSPGLLALCTIVANITIGDVPTMLRLLPRGRCLLCCPMQEERDIIFQLFTPHNQRWPDNLVLDNALLLRMSHFNRHLPTVFYVHGFTENNMGASSVAIRDAYLKRGGWNVILVDWSSLCTYPYYREAVQNTRIVGHYLAKFLTFLRDTGTPFSSVHVIGFSLGAQIAGLAGRELKGSLSRITGLDPAFPLYQRLRENRLDAIDAQFVDVIHGDGGVFGYPTPIGHVDFFPNDGGPIQPGCEIVRGLATQPNNVYAFVACSHQRSWRYYVESVLNEHGFLASTCHKWLKDMPEICHTHDHNQLSYMGFAADRSARGKFYLTTNRQSPFAKNLTEDQLPRPRGNTAHWGLATTLTRTSHRANTWETKPKSGK